MNSPFENLFWVCVFFWTIGGLVDGCIRQHRHDIILARLDSLNRDLAFMDSKLERIEEAIRRGITLDVRMIDDALTIEYRKGGDN